MAKVKANTWNDLDIEIEYETFGDAKDPALLLVMGFTAQLIAWDEDFCQQIADRGRYVIRFDNRDCGLSTKLHGVEVDAAAFMNAGRSPDPKDLPRPPYTLSDFSNDAFGLLTALGIEKAHILGASMGGMIVQTMAIEHPERVLSLTSVMSSTGEPGYGGSTKEASQRCWRQRRPTVKNSSHNRWNEVPSSALTKTLMQTNRQKSPLPLSTEVFIPKEWRDNLRQFVVPVIAEMD